MSDKNRDQANVAEGREIRFGERLQSMRESMGMSVQDAASRLHLSPRFIHLMENENLQACDLPQIYLRGYLRSYSRILNIPQAELNTVLEQLDPPPASVEMPAVASEALAISYPLAGNPYYARIASVLVSLILLTGMTTWWYHHSSAPSTTTITLNQEANNQNTDTANPNLSNNLAVSSNSTPATLNSMTLDNNSNAPTPAADNALSLNAKPALALATNDASTPSTTPSTPSKPVADAREEESSDEQD